MSCPPICGREDCQGAFANLCVEIEQEDSAQDGLGDSRHSRLDILPAGEFAPFAIASCLTSADSNRAADSRQVCPWLWLHLRPAERHRPQRQPILPRRFDRPNCATRMATLFLDPHRQSPPPNTDASIVFGMGYITSCHGRVP